MTTITATAITGLMVFRTTNTITTTTAATTTTITTIITILLQLQQPLLWAQGISRGWQLRVNNIWFIAYGR